MARHPQQSGTTAVQTLGHGPIEEVELPPVIDDAPIKGSAVREQREEVAGPVVRYFRVTKGGYVLDPSGYRTKMNEGKEIDSLNFDVKRLSSQGIRLVEIKETDRSSFPLSSFDMV